MEDFHTYQAALRCDSCGGQCAFSTTHQALQCRSCGHLSDLATPQDDTAQQEFQYCSDTPEAERPTQDTTHTHQCETCGGQVLFTGATLSENCPYCDGAVVRVPSANAYDATALIPFRISPQDARKNAQAWAGSRVAAPNDLPNVIRGAKAAAVYAPFWTFDSVEALDYWASYKVRRGKRSVTRKLRGSMTTRFDDLLVPASAHVTPLIRDGILHDFNPGDLKPCRPGYLAGFAAERHQQTVQEGLEANRADKDLLIKNRIRKHVNRSGLFNIGYRTDTSGIHYRRVLLPVYILHYRYKDVDKKVVVSGIDGRTFGERPFSWAKLAGYSALLSAGLILFGVAWGAGGLL